MHENRKQESDLLLVALKLKQWVEVEVKFEPKDKVKEKSVEVVHQCVVGDNQFQVLKAKAKVLMVKAVEKSLSFIVAAEEETLLVEVEQEEEEGEEANASSNEGRI